MRNVQLALLGIPISLAIALAQDGKKIAEAGILQGYTPLVWWVVVVTAFGGLVVATVLKHADNILKCFATAISVILTMFIAQVLGDFTPDLLFVLGTGLVLIATTLYSAGPSASLCWPLWEQAFMVGLPSKASPGSPQALPQVDLKAPAVLIGVV